MSGDSVMTKDEFLSLLDVYGAELKRWPQARQQPAQAYLDTADIEVKALFEDEKAFDSLLEFEVGSVEVPVELETRLLDLAPLPTQKRKSTGSLLALKQLSTPRWVSAVIAMSCFIGGAGAGYAGAISDVEQLAATEMMAFVEVDGLGFLDSFSTGEDE